MALTISNISAVLKKIIIPTIQSELPKQNVLFDKVKRNSGVTVANNTIYVAARTQRHSGIYSVAESTEPRSGKSAYAQPYDSIKYAFGTLELTDQSIEATSNGGVKALASILQTEINALKDDIVADFNRQMHGAGKGKLATVGSAATGLTVYLGTASGSLSPTGNDPTEYLVPGMYIHINTGEAVEISSVTPSSTTPTITLAAGNEAAPAVKDFVICKEQGSTILGTTGSSVEIMGLAGIIDDGDNIASIHNITRSTNAWACANVEDTATTLTEAQMVSLFLKCKRYGGPSVVMMNEPLYSKYGSLLTAIKRSADTKEILTGGWRGLDFMDNVGVMLDFDTWEGYVQMVDFNSLTIAEMTEPWKWLEADAHGGILKRSAENRTIWEGTLKYYCNLIGLKFKSQGRLRAKTGL